MPTTAEGRKRVPDTRLHFDADTHTVTLDGKDYSLDNPKAFLTYRAIAENGGPITRAELRGKVKGMNNPKAARAAVNTLPKALRDTVSSGSAGFWINLPPVKKKALP